MGTATISMKVYGVELRIFSVSVFDLRRVDAFFDDLLDRLSNVGIIVKKADSIPLPIASSPIANRCLSCLKICLDANKIGVLLTFSVWQHKFQ